MKKILKHNGIIFDNIPGLGKVYLDESMHDNEIIAWDTSKLKMIINKDTGEGMWVFE